MHPSHLRRTAWLSFLLPVLGTACSDAANGGDAPPKASAPALQTQAAGTGPQGGPAWPDGSWAASIHVPAGASCAAYPEGAGNDSRRDAITADSDGQVRLYPPPPSWGNRLTLDCAVDGASPRRYRIDFDDASTFTRQSRDDLAPKDFTIVPPLAGDIDAVAAEDLSRGGYPPRPDRATHRDMYEKWVQYVSAPRKRYRLVGAHTLGTKLQGAYKGWCSGENWHGVIQSPGGFSSPSTGCDVPLITNNNRVLFKDYAAATFVPSSDCSAGPCYVGLWAGIGGVPTDSGGSTVKRSSLIQNGFLITGTNKTQLVWEFAEGPPISSALPADVHVGDIMIITGAGWSGNGCSGSESTSAPFACFQFFDYTTGAAYHSAATNPGGDWWPDTVEYIVEVPGAAGNANYGTWKIDGQATDWNGNTHTDPGASTGTDPYMWSFQGDYQFSTWASGNFTVAQDPIIFQYQNYN